MVEHPAHAIPGHARRNGLEPLDRVQREPELEGWSHTLLGDAHEELLDHQLRLGERVEVLVLRRDELVMALDEERQEVEVQRTKLANTLTQLLLDLPVLSALLVELGEVVAE